MRAAARRTAVVAAVVTTAALLAPVAGAAGAPVPTSASGAVRAGSTVVASSVVAASRVPAPRPAVESRNASVRVTWTRVTKAAAYRVSWRQSSRGGWKVATVSKRAAARTITGLRNGTKVFVRVGARKGTTWSRYSATVSTVVGLPGAPRATAASQLFKAQVTWTAAAPNGSPVTGYQVRYRYTRTLSPISEFTPWFYVDAVSAASRTRFIGSPQGRRWELQVAARNRFGFGPWSNTARTTVPRQAQRTIVSANVLNTCTVLNTGEAKCWGNNGSGQLGNGTNVSFSTTPQLVSGITDAVGIGVGGAFACALRNLGSVSCWGSNLSGQLGDGTTTNRGTPVEVTGLDGATVLSAGNFSACAVRGSGRVLCWGSNTQGQLGVPSTTVQSPVPVEVPGLSQVTKVSVGGEFACALTTDGTVRCWGSGVLGQLGDGTAASGPTPRAVPIPAAVDVDAGNTGACAVLVDGTARCWGTNEYGQLGDGTTTNRLSPVTVSGLTGATRIDIGGTHACAVVASGLACWGGNFEGQLGNGTTVDSTTPVPVALAEGLEVVAGGVHTCGRDSLNAIYCWGRNLQGTLGDGTILTRLTPVPVGL
jgi:alpha-tubulin suppressor-like RCC1 family protein